MVDGEACDGETPPWISPVTGPDPRPSRRGHGRPRETTRRPSRRSPRIRRSPGPQPPRRRCPGHGTASRTCLPTPTPRDRLADLTRPDDDDDALHELFPSWFAKLVGRPGRVSITPSVVDIRIPALQREEPARPSFVQDRNAQGGNGRPSSGSLSGVLWRHARSCHSCNQDVRFEDRPDPVIVEPADAASARSPPASAVRTWRYRGIQQVTAATPIGHEYVGIVEQVGDAVTTVGRRLRGRRLPAQRQHVSGLPQGHARQLPALEALDGARRRGSASPMPTAP